MEAAPKKERLFTFASAGWVLLLAFAFTAVGTVWNLAPLFDPNRVKPRGDGRSPASYGFDLSKTLVPKETIVSSGMVVDALKALDDPATMDPKKVPLMAEVERGKYLVASDRVIGVEINGQSRAYPLRVLNWHEVVNDVVGGVPIVVTYHPLSEGVAVFDRRVGGETLKFSVSGLLHDSNLLMYDRREAPSKESLWSQLQARAIAGPSAGATLARIPCALSRFDRWTERYPQSDVLAPILAEVNDYKKDAYGTYFNADIIRYPVDPMPPENTLPPKQRILVLGEPGARRVIPLVTPKDQIRSDSAVGPDDGAIFDGVYAFWFAWYAAHPEDPGTIEE